MFHYVLLALAISGKRTLINRSSFMEQHFHKFLIFSIHSMCWMQDVEFKQDIRVLEGVFGQRALLEYVFVMNL